MTTRSAFNADEWATVAEAPLLAGLRVVAAERGGTLRESIAVGRAYAEARQRHGQSELLDQLVSAPPMVDPGRLREGGGDIAGLARTRVTDAARLVTEKATAEDAQAYREFVLTVAEAVAHANKEGGLAGFGGKPVSDAEQAAIDELRRALDGAP